MFLHLSSNESVLKRNVVGVFNLETASVQTDTKNFLKQSQKDMRTVTLGRDIPEAFVLCDDEYAETMYLTCISAETIEKRCMRKTANI